MSLSYPFSLVPFGQDPRSGLSDSFPTLRGTVRQVDWALEVDYQLGGDCGRVVWPVSNKPPTRRDNLWQHTCLEIFIALPSESRYWEFNMSPTGDWNAYEFSAYRQGMSSVTAVQQLDVEVTSSPASLKAIVPLNHCLEADKDSIVQLGISAVLETDDGQKLYYALVHCGDKPDFHNRQSFVMKTRVDTACNQI